MINKIKNFFSKENDTDKKYYISQMQILKLANLRLRHIYEENSKYEVSKEIIKIIKISDNIFNELVKNKNKIVKMNLFIEYYIQEVIKITENYFKIKKIKDKSSKQTCETIEKFLKCIVIAFNNIYKDLINYDKTNMEVDIGIILEELKHNLEEGKNE